MTEYSHPAAMPTDDYKYLASSYDRLTSGDDYERVAELYDDLLLHHGLKGRRLLDVACGTGKSTAALRARGYDLTGCDISENMLRQARSRPDLESVDLVCCDMRLLPPAFEGRFDAATCIDDAVNHLLTDDDLVASFSQVRRALRLGGLFAFDVNTRMTYVNWFTRDHIFEDDDGFLLWRGSPVQGASLPGAIRATITSLNPGATALATRTDTVVTQRHYDHETIERCLSTAGFRVLGAYGLLRGCTSQPPDEDKHVKTVFVAQAI